MKTLEQINMGLAEKYNGPIKEIRGFSYIPWNDTADAMNRIFGHMGWSSEVVKLDTAPSANCPGFIAIVRVTAYVDYGNGHSHQIVHDGVGFGEIQQKKDGTDLIDTAVKAAESDAFSRACKKLGDALGLFLYDKPETGAPTSNSSYTKPVASGGSAANDKRPSAGQLPYLMSGANGKPGIGLTQEQVDQLTFTQWKGLLDAFFKRDGSHHDLLEQLGIETTPKPTPAGSYPWQKAS